ncbi:hypothetical protein ES703_05872 [subsurface metagenome]
MKKLRVWLLAGLAVGLVVCEKPLDIGWIAVNSTPAGASVLLDGRLTGQKTNCLLADVAVGSHTVNITLEGYIQATQTVEIEGGDTATVNATLQVVPGFLQVNSTPTGAAIWLDDENTGEITNHLFTGVRPGSHKVKLVLEGFFEWERTVEVKSKDTTIVEANLAEAGALQVNSTPEEAQIWLDGENTGQVTDHLFDPLATGSYRVKLVKEGYFDWEDTVEVVAGQTTTVNATLIQWGNPQVNSTPKGAEIWLNGSNTGQLTDHLFERLAPGSYVVRLVLAGYKDWVDTVEVVGGQTTTIDANLSSATGNLQVNSTPTGAEIWLDGSNTGQLTNHLFEDVSPGSHIVKLTKEGYKDWIDTVEVVAGETTTIDATLEEIVVEEVELAYDDGTPTGGYFWGEAGYVSAVRMTPPAGTWKLKTARYYFTLVKGPVKVRILDDAGGTPGSDLIPGFNINPSTDWYDVDLESYNIMVTGDFYVGIEYLPTSDSTAYGYDPVDNGRAWDYWPPSDPPEGWEPWTETYFMRAVVQSQSGVEVILDSRWSGTATPLARLKGGSLPVIEHPVSRTR